MVKQEYSAIPPITSWFEGEVNFFRSLGDWYRYVEPYETPVLGFDATGNIFRIRALPKPKWYQCSPWETEIETTGGSDAAKLIEILKGWAERRIGTGLPAIDINFEFQAGKSLAEIVTKCAEFDGYT